MSQTLYDRPTRVSVDFNLLSRHQLGILRQSLLASFHPDRFEALLVGRGYGPLRNHTRSDNFPTQIGELIESLTRKGMMNNWMNHVLDYDPEAPDLRNLTQKLTLAKAEGNLEKFALDSGYSDINGWATHLVDLSTCVCRLSCLVDGERASCTGFLVAPNLVLTSHKVIENWIRHGVGPRDLKCNSGFAELNPQPRNTPTIGIADFSQGDPELDSVELKLTSETSGSKGGLIQFDAIEPPPHEASILLVIQSPYGMPLRMSTTQVQPSSSPLKLLYELETAKGGEGSLVITTDLKPVGIHQSGGVVVLAGRQGFEPR